MRHGDAFCGIGGFGLAARDLGWSTVWAAEIDESARAVYSARLGHDGLRFDRDIRESRDLPDLDILTGGFPCQDLSVAGKRRGLAGARSGLFFELVRILSESRPEWFVFENVPGLLSSHRGRDMAVVLDSLVECGYGVAYRVLNAQFFGVAQRRRRVFFVGHSSGQWERAAAVLFEPAGLRGDSETEREARGDVALASSLRAGYGKSGSPERHDLTLVTAGTLQGGGQRGWRVGAEEARDNFLIAQIQDVSGTRLKRQNGIGIDLDAHTGYTVTARDRHGVAFQTSQSGTRIDSVHCTLDGNNGARRRNGVICPSPDPNGVRTPSGLPRSLDVCPICEEGPDSPRYRGLGNAVAVPVVRWLFNRIEEQHMTELREIGRLKAQ